MTECVFLHLCVIRNLDLHHDNKMSDSEKVLCSHGKQYQGGTFSLLDNLELSEKILTKYFGQGEWQ